jgi:hypothetical protein
MKPESDPLWLPYLLATGNTDMLDRECNCICCRWITEGFARWKKNQEYDERQHTAKTGGTAAENS